MPQRVEKLSGPGIRVQDLHGFATSLQAGDDFFQRVGSADVPQTGVFQVQHDVCGRVLKINGVRQEAGGGKKTCP